MASTQTAVRAAAAHAGAARGNTMAKNNKTDAQILAETLASNAAIVETLPAKAKGGGGKRDAENTLYPVPDGTKLPIDSTPDFKIKGVTLDGIFAYAQRYSTGRIWEKKVTPLGSRHDSWKTARARWAKAKASK